MVLSTPNPLNIFSFEIDDFAKLFFKNMKDFGVCNFVLFGTHQSQ